MNNRLENLKKEIALLKRNVQDGRGKPHKLLMLLAVLDLAEDGLLVENRVYFEAALIERFQKYFHNAAGASDWPQAAPPFFHLRSSSFWNHAVKEGRDKQYAALTTSGGGSKRIQDNIAYSYLSNEAFSIFNTPEERHNLRDFIVAFFPPEESSQLKAMTSTTTPKLGTAFHESFRLNRSGISQILQIIANHEVSADADRKLTYDDFREKTSLGANQVKSFRRYAYGTGFVDENERLTIFGRQAVKHDSNLNNTTTLWLMHYHMAAPHKQGPLFWNHLASNYFAPHSEFSRELVSNEIKSFSLTQGDRELADDTYKVAATTFLGSYAETDALGQLGILENQDAKYFVRQPKSVPVGAFACILADYWTGVWGERGDVLLREVNEGPLATLLMVSSGEVNDLLGALSERGLVVRQRRVPPFKVSRGWNDVEALWREQLYS